MIFISFSNFFLDLNRKLQFVVKIRDFHLFFYFLFKVERDFVGRLKEMDSYEKGFRAASPKRWSLTIVFYSCKKCFEVHDEVV